MDTNSPTISLSGVRISSLPEKETKDLLVRRLKEKKKTAVYTPNPVMLARAWREPAFARVLRRAELCLPDGVGVTLAARLFHGERLPRLPGIDMGRFILSKAADLGCRVYLLGGKKGVAERAAVRLTHRYPRLIVCGCADGYFESEEKLLAEIRAASPDILLVCLGSPLQEEFIDRRRTFLPSVSLFMALGGSLDVWAGDKKRAPLLLREMGLEWLWRMMREPHRLLTIPSIALFFGGLMAEKAKNIVKLHSKDAEIFPF